MKEPAILLVIFLKLVYSTMGIIDDANPNYSLAHRQGRSLFFPQYTVLQLSIATISPIDVVGRKTAVNLGFQFNYNLPYQLKDFYSPIYWAARSLFHSTEIVRSGGDEDDIKDNYKTNTTQRVKRDASAGQIYGSIKDALLIAGYHDDCLLKSVCELARHPLEVESDNLIYEVMHFILTPSVHQSFDETEVEEKKLFGAAEEYGRNGGDCDLLYVNCSNSPLDHITNVVEEIE